MKISEKNRKNLLPKGVPSNCCPREWNDETRESNQGEGEPTKPCGRHGF